MALADGMKMRYFKTHLHLPSVHFMNKPIRMAPYIRRAGFGNLDHSISLLEYANEIVDFEIHSHITAGKLGKGV
jgi:hypothetical protein